MLTIAEEVKIEQVLEKSRFLCTLKKVQSEAEAQAFIKAMKKEHWDATHNCSAYIIDEATQRSNDDGEPAGTAGSPMLNVLRSKGLEQVAAVVTRWFGGIKLGTGGLTRAYAGTVAAAVAKAGLAKRYRVKVFAFSCTPVAGGKLLSRLYGQHLYPVVSAEHGENTVIALKLRPQEKEAAEKFVGEQLGRAPAFTFLREEWAEEKTDINL